jgi:hypothetical protein
MIIETTLETALSAKERGFRYVRSGHVAVVSVTGARGVSSISLRTVLKACVARFEATLHGWLLSLPHHRIVLFASTAFSAQHNALSRRRAIWGSEGLSWLPRAAARSDSVHINREDGEMRFAGLAEIDEASFFEAAEFMRTHAGSFLTVSARGDLTEERVRSIVAKVFPKADAAVNWSAAVAEVENGEDICIRASGGFDDPEASIDAFLSDGLLRKLEAASPGGPASPPLASR